MDSLITIKNRSDLYGIKKPDTDLLVYCSKDNTIYHLIDKSRSNKRDGWEQLFAIPKATQITTTIPSDYLNQTMADELYVKYQSATVYETQTIYGNVNVIGNITATGEVSAFTGSAPSNWWNSMPIASATVLGGFKVGANLTIDPVTGILNAAGGAGTAAWGSISGTLADQTDLDTALNAKASLAGCTFTGTVNGITYGMVGAAASSHNHDLAYDVINAASSSMSAHLSAYSHGDIANGQTAFGWGNHASAGYAVKANTETISGVWSFEGAASYTGGFYSAYSKYDFLINDGGWLVLGTNKTYYRSYIGWSNSGKYLDFGIEYYTDPTYFLFRGKDASGAVKTLAILSPRAGCEFYYTGTKRLETTSVGATIVGKLYINDSNTIIEEGSANALQITTDSGYVIIGPQNASYCHFITDRGEFYFGSRINIDQALNRYGDSDFLIQRNGTTKLTIGSTSIIFENTVYSKGDVIAYST